MDNRPDFMPGVRVHHERLEEIHKRSPGEDMNNTGQPIVIGLYTGCSTSYILQQSYMPTEL